MIGEVIKGDFRDRCLLRALGLLEDRGKYWANQKDYKRCGCYDSAANILRYAMNEDWEALNQYDYYDEV